jgi:hypothetical protein
VETVATAPTASASSPSWCWVGGGWSSTCEAYWNQYLGGQWSIPNNTEVYMQCYTYGSSADFNYWTNKWFRVWIPNYNMIMWMPADEVWYQSSVGHC